MATKLTIQIGPLTVEKSFADDARASAILQAFYADHRLGPDDATNRQKLEAILDWFADYVQAKARQRHIEQARDAAIQEAETTYAWE